MKFLRQYWKNIPEPHFNAFCSYFKEERAIGCSLNF